MGDQPAELWSDPAAVERWQKLFDEAALSIADRVGLRLETAITRRGNVLWGQLGDLHLRLAPAEIADVTTAEFPESAARWAHVRHPGQNNEVSAILADMMSTATSQSSVAASAGIVWPRATPPALLDLFANGDAPLDDLLRKGLRHLGFRTTPADDGTFRFLETHWFELPELMPNRLFIKGPGAELMSRYLIAIMLARGQHLDAWGGLAKDVASFPEGDIDHGPWRARMITADTYEAMTPDAAQLLLEQWPTQEYQVPLPDRVLAVLAEITRAITRSSACFRLPQLPDEAETAISAYGSYLEIVFVDLVTRELGLIVLSDD